jgi:hypothetical protein
LLSYSSICQSFLLSCWAIWVLFRKSLPMLINSSVFPTLSCTSFKVSGAILRSLIYFELTLYRVKNMNLLSISCRQISSFSGNICWRGCLFSIICFGKLYQKSGGPRSVESYPDPLFCSVGLHICFCAGTMLFFIFMAL